MNSLRAVSMVALLAGLAGLASAQVTVTLAISPSTTTITYGTPVTLIADVFGDNSCGGKQVTFAFGVSLGAATATQVAFSPAEPECIAVLTPNSYTPGPAGFVDCVSAVYNSKVSSCVDVTVNQAPTTVSLVPSPNPSTYGQTVTLTATVSPPNGSVGAAPTGDVTFNYGLGTVHSGLSNGVSLVEVFTYPPGIFTLTATYNGDMNYLGSSSSAVTQRINQIATTTSLQAVPTSSTAGQNVVLTATVSPTAATGTVTFLDGGTAVGTGPVNGGTASFSTSSLAVGSHSLTASYGGDTNDLPSVSSAVTETVNQIPTTTSLQAIPASSTPGQTVVLTATVSPSAATGTVTFLDRGTSIGTAQLSGGTASFSASALSIGSHSLSASYGGDANDAQSVSPAVTESVGLLTTTTTLTAAPNPSTAGQKVTLTATVSPGNPTGTVSFFDGANLLGTTSVASGVAALSTAALSAGNHSLTATYSGDANNATSTSAAVNESVTGGTGSTTPNPVSVSPASGGGSSQVMVFTFNDASGWQDLGVVNVLINNVLDGRNACYLAYSRSAGVLYLVADDGGTLSTGLVLGGAGSVSNSQCAVTGSASAAFGSGNTLTVALNIIFTAGFGGNKVVYLAAGDVAGGNSGWQGLGVWQAPFTPSGTIAVVSLTQARSAAASGTAQTFTATLTDSQGTGDFGVVNLLVNNFIDGRSACYLAYVASTNSLLLVDDGGDAGGPFAGGVVLNGVAATIQNSQCSVNRVGSSAAKSGNTLTLMLNITFQSPFAGNRIVWVAGRDQASGNNTDWQAMGTTTVQ